jgi:hypothetical protein
MAEIYSSAGIRIIGQKLGLEDISRELGLVPSHVHRAGEFDKFGEPYAQDMWLLESPLGKHRELDSHLEWLIQHLESRFGYLKTLKGQAKIDVFCGYTSIDDGGLSLSPEALSIFVELGIPMELSIIVLRKKD